MLQFWVWSSLIFFYVIVSQCKWVSGIDTYDARIAADSIIWELFARKSAECLYLRNWFTTISSLFYSEQILILCSAQTKPNEKHACCKGAERKKTLLSRGSLRSIQFLLHHDVSLFSHWIWKYFHSLVYIHENCCISCWGTAVCFFLEKLG